MTFKTEQENFWAGNFGTEYINRNNGDALLASNLNFFAKGLRQVREINNCIEFGANIGMNLRALKLLHPNIQTHAIEINTDAAKELQAVIPKNQIYNQSIHEFVPKRKWDLVLIKGVLIHLNPEVLTDVYDKLYDSCGRYLFIAEYYNPVPVTIPYRGHKDRLFKRDFAGEILDRYKDFELIDYGFSYKRDPIFPQDDITWFVLEKNNIN